MTAYSLFRWDDDRSRPRPKLPFLTFSIAIFQWQPKASGKGLKKVNASRVHGYETDRKSDCLRIEPGYALRRTQTFRFITPAPSIANSTIRSSFEFVASASD